jgi:hypothetical protein
MSNTNHDEIKPRYDEIKPKYDEIKPKYDEIKPKYDEIKPKYDEMSDEELTELSKKSKYVVYRNDIKFKDHRLIDPTRAIFADKEVENDYMNHNTDDIEYRVQQCVREKYSYLDLSHMKSDCIEKLCHHELYQKIIENVKHLFVDGSELTKLDTVEKFINLQTLDASNNQLTNLPNLPETLEELILTNNKISRFDQKLPCLKILVASNNLLKHIEYPNKLGRLEISNNPIKLLGSTKELYFLDISNTLITVIPENFDQVEYLDCCKTHVTTIPQMKKLKTLRCNDSMVFDISKLTMLETLEMVRCLINAIHHIPTLKDLTYSNSTQLKLSSKYKILNLRQNKMDIIKIRFI